MPADTTIDTPEIIVRALTGSSTPTSSGPVVSVLTHPGYDLAADYVEPAGGDWVSEFPIRVRSDGKGVVNWTHAIPVGLGAVEHKAIAGDTGELILATGLTDFFQSVGDLNGIDLTEYESPSSRTPIGRYTADECLRAAADAEALVRGGYATGVSIEFRPNGPKGSVEGEGAYWDREVKSPMLPRPARHFKSWTGLAYAHARKPVNPGCHTVIQDADVEVVAKCIRVMETGKVGEHRLSERVLKSFRDDAPDLAALVREYRRSTVTVEGTPPKRDDVPPKAEPAPAEKVVKAKSDAWVKWKIRKIMAEGIRGKKVSRKQAVAVAYSMVGRSEKEAKAVPDASELVSLVRNEWFHKNGNPATRAMTHQAVQSIAEEFGVSKEVAGFAYQEARRYAAADWKKFKATSGEFCPKCDARLERDGDVCNSCGHEYKAYTGPLRASGKLNTNPNVEDEERGDDEPDFEIPELDDEEDDRDTKALRINGPEVEVARTKSGAAVHNMNLAARDARIKSYAAVEDHAHPTVRYALMASRALQRGDYERAGGAHLGAIREHEKELRKAGLSDYTRSRHEAAIQDHRLAAKKLHDHLLSQGWVSPRRQREVAATTPAPSTVRRPLYSGLEGSPYRPAVKPSAIDTATYEASKRQLTGPVEPAAAKRGIVGGLLKRLGITKAFEDDVSDPYEVARIASGLAMKTGNDREAKATIARKSPAEMKAYHERAADNPRLDADAADRHLRAAEMWERAMVPSPVRLGNGRPYMKARTDGFDVPAVAMGPDERPPASISALMNFAQLQMDGAEALAYDAQQSDDLMFRTYAKALATQAQTAAATLQKQASAMQQYLNGAANNGGMQKHPLMGVLNTGQAGDQNQPGTTTSGDVPPGADGTTADDADDVTATGAQKAFTDDAALDSLFAEPVPVPAGPDVDEDGWLVFKAFPEWKPRRYAMSELRDLPRANTGGAANKSAATNTAAAVQTPVTPTVEAKADEWANPEVAAKLSELTAQLKKLKQLDEAVQHRQQRGGW